MATEEQYQVLHVEKRVSIPSGLNRHITREEWITDTVTETKRITRWVPDNADKTKSHLNRELISRVWEDSDGIRRKHSIQEQVNKRLKEAGIKKLRKGQNTCLEIILSGSPDAMKNMDSAKQLQWADDSLEWAQETFGKENVVNATLHLDEKTPHIHLIVVPLVTGESKETKRFKKLRKSTQRKTYNIDTSKARLCAHEVFTKQNLYKWHDSYFRKVGDGYGLSRGIRAEPGSEKSHESSIEYNRRLKREIKQKEQELAVLRKEEEQKSSNINKITKKVSAFIAGGQTEIEAENSKLWLYVKELEEDLEKEKALLYSKTIEQEEAAVKIAELSKQLSVAKNNLTQATEKAEAEKKVTAELHAAELKQEKEKFTALVTRINASMKTLYAAFCELPAQTQKLDEIFGRYFKLEVIKKNWVKQEQPQRPQHQSQNHQSHRNNGIRF